MGMCLVIKIICRICKSKYESYCTIKGRYVIGTEGVELSIATLAETTVEVS